MSHKLLKTRILEWFKSPEARAADKSELARILKIRPEGKAELRAALRDLLEEGTLVEGKKGRFRLPGEVSGKAGSPGGSLLVGKLSVRPGGLFFVPDTGVPENLPAMKALAITPETLLPVDPARAATALGGDRVSVKPMAPPDKRDRRVREVRVQVVSVLERRNETIPGTLHVKGKHAWVQPDDLFLPAVEVQISERSLAAPGDKVVAAVDDWQPRGKRLRGHLLKRLGAAGEPGVDVLGIIAKHRLRMEFPREVVQQAEAFPDEIPADEIARREDWREKHVITIDPFDAKDFDDAICVTDLPGGGWELAVHIADVSHYVRPGTALDKEALRRGNSTYLVDRVLPMLPEHLSNGLCSLRPFEDKLTRAAVMTFDDKGRRTGQRFVSAVIRSRRRYTYEEAMATLKEPPGRDPDAKLIHRAWKLASLMRQRRFNNGSLDMQFTEVKVILDAEGHPVRFARIAYDESHQLIEEFMLAANEAVAEAMLRSGRPGMYRIHEDPDPAKLDELREIFIAHGFRCGDLKVKGEIQKVLNAIEGKPEEHILKVALLKSLKRAVYSPDSVGHYGLSLRHYTHFTSPIRRYADLVVHRVLGNFTAAPGAKGSTRTPDYAAMKEMAEHISTTERASADAEMDSRRMKELEFFERIVSSGKREVFKAVITRVLPIGLFVEVVDIQTRGIVRAGDPACGDFRFDHSRNCLVSRNGRLVIRASDIIDVIPVGIERERGTVVFKITGKPGAERPRAAPMTLEQHRRPKEGRPPRESRTPRPGRKPRKSRPPRESRNKRKGQQ
jgi:ribonuclease R